MRNTMIPLACSFSESNTARQDLDWATVRNQSLGTVPIENGIAMTFSPDKADDIESLVKSESACCGFLSITSVRSDEMIRVEISSTDPAALPVIQAIAAVASPSNAQ